MSIIQVCNRNHIHAIFYCFDCCGSAVPDSLRRLAGEEERQL
jgi:hypothetical protein